VCEAKPRFERPAPQPTGVVKFGYKVPASWGYPELTGAYSASGSTVPIGTEAKHPDTGENCVLGSYGTGIAGPPKFWFPVEA